MSLKTKQWGTALYKIVKKTSPEQLPAALKEFAILLVQQGLISQLEKILTDFIHCYNIKENISDVILESLYDLTYAEQQNIISELKRNINQEINLQIKINKELLGGAIFYVNDYLADGSLSGQLKKLKTEFVNDF